MPGSTGICRDSLRRTLLISCILASAAILSAQETVRYEADKNWHDVCRRVMSQLLIPNRSSGPLTEKQLRTCDESALYYGLGRKPNYSAALQCGWFQRAHPQHLVGSMFYGPGVLTMIYANGKGVLRDYELAIRFTCENERAAEAESAYRIGHLEYLQATPSETVAFDLCDDITSGLSDGFCTGVQTRAATAVRARKIALIVRSLSPAANIEFRQLQSAETEFENARGAGEVDLSGTSRAALYLAEKSRLEDQFLINLRRFEQNDIPGASATDLDLLDRTLNETYQRLQHSPPGKWQFGTVTPAGIRKAERNWISLTAAWSAFARIAYPRLSETRIRAQLIRLRLHQLQSIEGN